VVEPDPRVVEGLRRLRRREWYAAHDAIEPAWRDATGETRTFLQGLIHAAISLEHLGRGNPRGARSQWQKAVPKLTRLRTHPYELDVDAWASSIEDFFADVDLDGRAEAQARQEPPEPLPAAESWPALP